MKIYSLKQETPMIHFQYSETGAILRASDVKPRLDKFLIRQMSQEQKDRFAISREHPALDYKMQLIAEGRPKITGDIARSIAGSYFGNMGDQGSHKKTVLYNNPISLRIICFHPDLMEMIDQNIEGFFLLNNFGTRQDKGFGSFRIIGHRGKSAAELFRKYAAAEKYIAFEIDDSRCERRRQKTGHLDNADIFYKLLKSGINCSRPNSNTGTRETVCYEKSLLTRYMLAKGIGGEKRWMKEQGIAPAIGKSSEQSRDYTNIHDYKYIRALLGTGDRQEWLMEEGSTNKTTIDISPAAGNPIQRFQSPLTFTVYNGKLYVIVHDPDPIIFDQEFKFSGSRTQNCKTPSAADFSMTDFMRYVQKEIKNLKIRYYGGGFYIFSMTEVTA